MQSHPLERNCYVRAILWLFWIQLAFSATVLVVRMDSAHLADFKRAFFSVLGAALWFGLMAAFSTTSLLLLRVIEKWEWLPFGLGWAGCVFLMHRVAPEYPLWWTIAISSSAVMTIGLGVSALARRPRPLRREIALSALLPTVACLPGGYALFCSSLFGPQCHDIKAMVIDQALGSSARQLCAWVVAIPKLASALYIAYYAVPLILFILFYLGYRKGRSGAEVVFHYCLAAFIGAIFYTLVPIVGPMQTFRGYPAQFPGSAILLANLGRVLELPAAYPRNCMPSLHLTWALIFWLHSRRHGKGWQLLAAVFALVTVMSTLGLGYHYEVDLIPSFPFALLIFGFIPDRRWRPGRTTAVLAALTLFWVFCPLVLAETMFLHPWATRLLALATIGHFFFVHGKVGTFQDWRLDAESGSPAGEPHMPLDPAQAG